MRVTKVTVRLSRKITRKTGENFDSWEASHGLTAEFDHTKELLTNVTDKLREVCKMEIAESLNQAPDLIILESNDGFKRLDQDLGYS
jgi:hypothetical protein